MTPLISIIVPCRSRPEELDVLLRSLERSSYPAREVIVIDDASPDPLEPALGARPGVRFLRVARRVGPAAAKNIGARASSGDYLLFMDSDTELAAPAMLEAMLEVFHTRADCGIVGGEWILRDGAWRHPLRSFGPTGALETRLVDGPLALTAEVSHLSSSNLMIRRALFERLGGYWEPYDYIMEDADLCAACRAAGLRVYTSSDVSVRHFRSATARSSFRVRMMNARNQALFWLCRGRVRAGLGRLARGMRPSQPFAAAASALAVAAALPAVARRRARSPGELTWP
ncbi:MAG: glycosyltransferase [Elusimicrobia bacterium]|nr:glycosyltransferase [Elusimicrobiota bacterium]